MKSFVSTIGSYPSYALHGCPKSKSTPGFFTSFLHVCKLVLLYTVYLHHNTSTHSDFSLLFCYDNAVMIVFDNITIGFHYSDKYSLCKKKLFIFYTIFYRMFAFSFT